MKSLRQLVEDIQQQLGQQQPPASPPPQTSQQPQIGQQPEGKTIELPKLNLIVSVFEQEKKINFAPLDKSRPTPKVRTLINQLKGKYKISDVQQQPGNLFVVILDAREDTNIVLDFIQQYEI